VVKKKAMSTPAGRTPRAQEMFTHIENYLAAKGRASGLNPKAFCEQEGVALSAFHNWSQKYRVHQHQLENPPASRSNFIPLPVWRAPIAAPPLSCVIEFPNGVIIRLSGQVDMLSRIADHPHRCVTELLPHNWKIPSPK
jgi:hypothetical protein